MSDASGQSDRMDLLIDEELVRTLLKEQHPDLSGLGLRLVDGGWDNQLWRLGEELAVRLPLTGRATELLHKEYRRLPELAPRLPLPTPVPLRIGTPSTAFPRPWTVASWVPGTPADFAPVSDGRGPHSADTLAEFLGALHLPAPADAPLNPMRPVQLSALVDLYGDHVTSAAPAEVADEVNRVWDEALAAPGWAGPPRWVHADLHPANVVTADGTLTGVIDFGDLCAGDPAVDLASAWVLLPSGASERFFTAYARTGVLADAMAGGLDAATVRRARGWAVLRALALIGIGRAGDLGEPGGKPSWGPAGRAALARALADPGPAGILRAV
ncbi:aminoglycoside phosphotransferase family protein [Streptomyces sp. NPDC004111]|uniref:aminoglycoside phosphotransferase family protein n=1 Tax=Streptomyces sp. NPDC004111 TaxID=3364690 RepID=UPI0036C77092